MKKYLAYAAVSALAIAACSNATSADSQAQTTSGKVSPPVERLDLSTSKGAHLAMRKVQCSLVDNEPVTYYWFGSAFSRRMGERDKKIFDVEGMNVRSCSTLNDPEKGLGYHLVTREILLYKDPQTGKVLKTWDNPWTGETVDVLHVANDPVNNKSYVTGRDGKPISFAGDVLGKKWQMNFTIPLFYPNPLASEFEAEIGGTYHATEMFNFLGDVNDLTNMGRNTADVAVGWARVSDWLPWMKMNGREGTMYMHTAGLKLESWDDLSDTLKSEIRNHYPEYTSPPEAGDPRPNMTSWKYYKGVKDGSIKLPKR